MAMKLSLNIRASALQFGPNCGVCSSYIWFQNCSSVIGLNMLFLCSVLDFCACCFSGLKN